MVLDADAAYLALKTRDARFDGRLFVGVTSTGVYCRPVCRVRLPRRENCRFFDTRAQAEAARFRPCLKCRPEIAPGLSLADSSRSLAADAARFIERAVHGGEAIDMPTLARRLGVTDRHLRRIFVAAHGVAPHDYLTTQRLLLAKQLLTDTAQPVIAVALASGFGSLRRFNAAFAERYRLNPTAVRRARANTSTASALRLAYRPPLDIEALLG
ncbi:MAG: methylphosphotriester-DNA--protein-cysteine methyltransferase family protein, partial [Burkholderiales bacterium]|nr:methylphosphotriester-DNA--protein-cysteine methyltransferase family protein [Burkholderiales bacterium]